MIFDTHAHYDDGHFDEDRDDALSESFNEGVDVIVNVCSDIPSLDTTPALVKRYNRMFCAVGIHPSELDGMDESVLERIKALALDRLNKVLAIGEIGLDYYWEKDEAAREDQRKWFRAQLELAKELKLPVIIHSREAAKDTFDILESFENDGAPSKGVIHCYSYSPEMAREYVKRGWFLGIGGVLTYKNAKSLVNTVAETDISHLVTETDCPYLAPTPHRGERNESMYIAYIIEKIAELKGMSKEEAEAILFDNAKRLYGLN